MKNYVSYLRVSTQRQGEEGYGLDAQRSAVATFVQSQGGTLLKEFAEIESGRRNDRPQLAQAIAWCRKKKAVLCIGKLDRLSRNAAFLLSLQDAKVDFTCCDMPAADRFTISILACVAQREAELISERTKEGLAAAKRQGVRLGAPARKLAHARRKAWQATRRKSADFALKLAPTLLEIKQAGVTTLKGTARCLNARGVQTPQGRQWTRQGVAKVQRRLARI